MTLALLNLSEANLRDRMALTQGCTASDVVLVEILAHKRDVTVVRTLGYAVQAIIRVPDVYGVLITEDDVS
jgi:hypothetical protein